MNPGKDLSGKWAVVTGASRGIGKAIARRLAGEEINLALHYRRSLTEAEEVAARCRQVGVSVKLFQADLALPAEADRLVHELMDALERVDILVNNAGHVQVGPFWTQEDSDWDAVMQVNLECPRRLMRAFLPGMVSRGWGRVINISSILAEWGGRGNSAYAVSKAGLNALSRSVALEVARKGITVNSIAPGLVETDMIADLSTEEKKEVLKRIPLRRAAQPEEVAEAVAFCCRCGYFTGEILRLEGGLSHGF